MYLIFATDLSNDHVDRLHNIYCSSYKLVASVFWEDDFSEKTVLHISCADAISSYPHYRSMLTKYVKNMCLVLQHLYLYTSLLQVIWFHLIIS